MAAGHATADATSFELVATQGLDTYGICSAPFLASRLRTIEFRIKVTFNADGTWAYDEETVLCRSWARTVSSTTPTATR